MENLEICLMQIISFSGEARSFCFEALQQLREGKHDDSKHTYQLAKEKLYNAKHEHAKLLKEFAGGELENTNLLMVHAEDQMMAAETIYQLANELFYCMK